MDAVARFIVKIINLLTSAAQNFWNNITLLDLSLPQVLLDILLVSILFYYIFLLLKGSRAIHIALGLFVLAVIFALSKAFSFLALGWIMERFFTIILVAIPIIFQQELRSLLERLGQPKWFRSRLKKADEYVQSLTDAIGELAHEKRGALVVFQQKSPLKEYMATGVVLDAQPSRELLLSIFHVKSPLHDGAVILDGQKILAAACTLPVSESSSHGHGTRHKAALGITEQTDAKVVVVSEERGAISLVENGRMESHVSRDRLKQFLSHIAKPAS